MFKALLFDLDGTLLNVDMNFFLPKYFKKMESLAYARGYHGADQLVDQVLKATGAMIANRNPDCKNEEVFMKDFFAGWHYPREEFEGFFADFYRVCFPDLQQYSQPFSMAPQVMRHLAGVNIMKVIATNPVFPHTAIEQRMEWAGIAQFHFDLVTTYENMHFCKPHQEYYREICDIIKVDPTECLMIGNDVEQDMVAGETGMKTYLVQDLLVSRGKKNYQPDWKGFWPDLYRFIRSTVTLS